MKLPLLLLTLLVLAFSAGAFLSARSGQRENASGLSQKAHIRWETSFNASVEKAKASHRLMLVDFYASWCGYCKQMDKTTYQNQDLVRLSRKFICTRIDVDEQETLAQDFKIDGLPTLVFWDPQKAEVKRLEGYVSPAGLLSVMSRLLSSR